jgi:hypothetical protein
VRAAQPSIAGVRREQLAVPDRPARWTLVSSSGWGPTEARAIELFRSIARSTLRARTLALVAITAVIVVLLVLLTNR